MTKYKPYTMADVPEPGPIKVASTFSGAGGSCLGYRLAGCDVVYAAEFVERAQRVYKANHPNSYLDGRDVRNITAESILEILGMEPGELDIFDGSPPCSAFSAAGIRDKGWGKSKNYSDTEQVVDDLFFEYVRLIEGVQPKVFIAENVKGLALGTAKGYMKAIAGAMSEAGYNVRAKIINAAHLGVPQKRERMIFIGVRKDLDKRPVFPTPAKEATILRGAFDGLEDAPIESSAMLTKGTKIHKLWHITIPGTSFFTGLNRQKDTGAFYTHRRCSWDIPAGTATTSADLYHPDTPRRFSIAELKRVCGFPDDFDLSDMESFTPKWERLTRAVPPLMMKAIAEAVVREIFEVGS